MGKLMALPPPSPIQPVTQVLHGVTIADPYRWLEDQHSQQTRAWLEAQTSYTRCYFDALPGRERIRQRIRELLDVETYDCLQKAGDRYYFRKRLPGQEQPCICFREGVGGKDQLLLDPADVGGGKHTAVLPLRVSPDGRLLAYQVKQGGERTGSYGLFDIETREIIADALPRGYLRGLAFAPDSRSFYYVHEGSESKRPHYRAAYQHVLGTSTDRDRQIFFAGERDDLRLLLVSGGRRLGFLVYRMAEQTYTDFWVWPLESESVPEPVLENANYKFGPLLLESGRILAITDRDAPNLRIVEVRRSGQAAEFIDVIPTRDATIQGWVVTRDLIFVSYFCQTKTQVEIFDLGGRPLGPLPVAEWETVRLSGGCADEDQLFYEHESFTQPISIYGYSHHDRQVSLWAQRRVPFASRRYGHTRVWFPGGDGTLVPMFLAGRRDILDSGPHPTIMTSYGGYGVSMTPQFSVFVAFLMEHGCLFALPNIRGGSEFGAEWHKAAQRLNKQVAFDDFLCAAQWLITSGRSEAQRLAIFGGSNAGLLVGAALTQRPDLFRAVICMVPILDMLRYHLFDDARHWHDEYGTAEDSLDFAALIRYSPYHRVRDGVAYPAVMLVSGAADQNCHPGHACKMAARLQAANTSEHPILLDYSRFRGHSPVLPLSERIESLADRMAFLCDQLQLPV